MIASSCVSGIAVPNRASGVASTSSRCGPTRRAVIPAIACRSCAYADWSSSRRAATSFRPSATKQEQPAQPTQDEFDASGMSEEDIEKAVTPAMKFFLEMLEAEDKTFDELAEARLELGFKRAADGRISVVDSNGEWYTVKTDMMKAGYLLLRRESDASVFYSKPSMEEKLQQIDLSDDANVCMLFGNGAWMEYIVPLQIEDDEGNVEDFKIDAKDFRNVPGLLDGAVESSE